MATIVAGNIFQENLVFGYDSGYGIADNDTATKFYPGALTTNIVPLNLSNSSWFNEYSSGRTLRSETLFGQPSYEFKSNDGQIWVSPFAFNSYDRSSNDLTLSVYAKNISGTNAVINAYLGGDFSTDSLGKSAYETVVADNTWRRYSWTRFSSAMSTNYLEFRTANTGVVISCPQLQIGRVVTPIVDGTRSSTESLIDLTRTTDIDVSNVSFDSTGQPSYDETDDHITGVLPMDGLGAAHTIEMIFSCSVNQGSIGGRKDPFSIGNSSVHQYSALDVNSGNMNWYFYGRDTTFTNSPLMVANKFYHIVLSYAGGYSNNTNKKVWINGVQQTLSSGYNETPLLPNNPSFSVGRDRGRNTAYWPGEIPVWRVYQKALTQDEAKQNYNAYKNRFNL
jgi:hypothetical protein